MPAKLLLEKTGIRAYGNGETHLCRSNSARISRARGRQKSRRIVQFNESFKNRL